MIRGAITCSFHIARSNGDGKSLNFPRNRFYVVRMEPRKSMARARRTERDFFLLSIRHVLEIISCAEKFTPCFPTP